MDELLGYGRAVVLSLTAMAELLLALRARNTSARRELFWFALALLFVGWHGGAPPLLLPPASAFALLWALGGYAARLDGQARLAPWHAAVGATCLVLGLGLLLGYPGTLPWRLLASFCYLCLAAYPGLLLARLWRRGGSSERLYAGAAAAAAAAAGIQLLPGRAAAALPGASIAVSASYAGLCTFLLAQEGYFRGADRRELARRLGLQSRKLQTAFRRLAEAESSLQLQDRLAASGLLAAGAAHEFKNVLAGILVSAEFGLREEAPRGDRARRALEMVREHARGGQRTVAALLEQVSAAREEEPQGVDLRRELQPLLRLLRSSCRRAGVSFSADVPPGIAARVRRSELRPLLLDVLRNALDAVGAAPGACGSAGSSGAGGALGSGPPAEVALRCRRCAGAVLVEIRDSGAGVAPQQAARLFDPCYSGKGSSGLGLYLARALAERNGGTLECLPVPAGACFRLSLPLFPGEQQSPPQPGAAGA